MKRRMVVVGIGANTSFGNVDETWKNLILGNSGIGSLTLFDPTEFDDLYARHASEIKDWDKILPDVIEAWAINQKIKTMEVSKMIKRFANRSTQFAFASATQTIMMSGIDLIKMSEAEKQKAGIVVATGTAGHFNVESSKINVPEINKIYNKSLGRLSPYQVIIDMINSSTAFIAKSLKFQGPSSTCSTACSSGNAAIIECCRRILLDEADIMLAIGTDACLTPYVMTGFCQMNALSKTGISCPFSNDRNGFVIGEGSAALLVTSLEFAIKHNLSILAEIVGYAETCDASSLFSPGDQQSVCMEKALTNAWIKPRDINYINAHGTSTPEGDKHETEEIKKVFGNYAYIIPTSSTKSMTGHLIGAAGTLESIVCIKTILEEIIPPTINYINRDPECDLDYTPNTSIRQKVIYAMNNSFGFGGQNAVIIFKKYEN